MRFAESYYAFGFWIVLVLTLFLVWAFRNKKKAMQRFAENSSLDEITASVNFKRQKQKSAIIICVFILGILSLMRPQWGFHWQKINRRGLDILIAVDVSKSMLATDVKPNRLERSKWAIKDLLKKLEGDRIGLIAFSGTAFLQCPLTLDYNGFLLALNDLNVNIIPRGGTSISKAIKVAMQSYEGDHQKKYNVLIIITDGEDHEGNAIKLAKEAKKIGLKIFCVGIGTNEGELIRLKGKSGIHTFLKDNQGNVVKSRLDENVLQKIALTTGGIYVRSSGAQFGLELIYRKKLSGMKKREIKARMAKLYYNRFQIPLAFAFLLLMLELLISDKKKR